MLDAGQKPQIACFNGRSRGHTQVGSHKAHNLQNIKSNQSTEQAKAVLVHNDRSHGSYIRDKIAQEQNAGWVISWLDAGLAEKQTKN